MEVHSYVSNGACRHQVTAHGLSCLFAPSGLILGKNGPDNKGFQGNWRSSPTRTATISAFSTNRVASRVFNGCKRTRLGSGIQ